MTDPLKNSVLETLNEALLSHGHFDSPDVADTVTKLLRAIDADLDGEGYVPSSITETCAADIDEAILRADSTLDDSTEDDLPEPPETPAKDF
jgi:hypothetical protein